MIALYPSYPSRPREPDPAFGWEVEAAKVAGFEIAFVDLEMQLGGDVLLRRLPEGEHDVVYRGWIVKPEDYGRLETAIRARECRLVEGFEAYRMAYEFPRWYSKLKGMTPRSIFIDLLPRVSGPPMFDLDAIAERVATEFQSRSDEQPSVSLKEGAGARPIMLKDWIKSRKQDWFDACFIPDSQDRQHTKKVIARFLELTDGRPEGGLVFREFESFKRIGTHPKTRMPIVNEWRGFLVHGKLVYLAPYWASGDYSAVERPEPAMFEDIVGHSGLFSPFISVDVAEKDEGTWTTVEVNSGGASGVPEGGNVNAFYQALRGAFP